MKISTTTGYFARTYGDKKAIVKIAQAGFDAVDYSLYVHDAETGVFSNKGFEKYAAEIKTVADASGIKIGQIHAHTPRPSYPDYIARRELFDKLAVNSIISAAIMDCPYVVIHPLIMLDRIYDYKYQENYDANIEYYGKMIPYLKEYGVKVAIENMWHVDEEKNAICSTVCSSAEEMLSLANDLGDDFVICLDVGHAVLTGRTADDMVRKIGDKLKVLHVHDNNGYDDNHDIPFNGLGLNSSHTKTDRKIDWDAFMKALKDINYSGTFSLEADAFLRKFPPQLAEDSSAFMAKVARCLVNEYEL